MNLKNLKKNILNYKKNYRKCEKNCLKRFATFIFMLVICGNLFAQNINADTRYYKELIVVNKDVAFKDKIDANALKTAKIYYEVVFKNNKPIEITYQIGDEAIYTHQLVDKRKLDTKLENTVTRLNYSIFQKHGEVFRIENNNRFEVSNIIIFDAELNKSMVLYYKEDKINRITHFQSGLIVAEDFFKGGRIERFKIYEYSANSNELLSIKEYQEKVLKLATFFVNGRKTEVKLYQEGKIYATYNYNSDEKLIEIEYKNETKSKTVNMEQ